VFAPEVRVARLPSDRDVAGEPAFHESEEAVASALRVVGEMLTRLDRIVRIDLTGEEIDDLRQFGPADALDLERVTHCTQNSLPSTEFHSSSGMRQALSASSHEPKPAGGACNS